MASLPYITAPGNIEKALNGIKSATTPSMVSQDFVKTILKISGGSGSQMTSFLKKIGFAHSDSSPSDLYKQFRNTATSGKAVADALRIGYAPLCKRNEYMHELSDKELKGLIIEETGTSADSKVLNLVFSAIKSLKKHANFSETTEATEEETVPATMPPKTNYSNTHQVKNMGMNLSYTINLNLPATSDIAVFNAIFKSLKENLLEDANE